MIRARLILTTLALAFGAFVHGSALAHDEVPPLPFANNPDPNQCGIPRMLGEGVLGVLHGEFDGVLQEPIVHLVDSHLRRAVTGHVPAGTVVEVIMYQDNPALDFYFVRWHGPDGIQEGWVPAPYLDIQR